MTFTRVTSITDISPPFCPNCNKKMEKHKAMNGYHWFCPDYWSCGGIIDIKNDEN